jgi:hypothetical protein
MSGGNSIYVIQISYDQCDADISVTLRHETFSGNINGFESWHCKNQYISTLLPRPATQAVFLPMISIFYNLHIDECSLSKALLSQK